MLTEKDLSLAQMQGAEKQEVCSECGASLLIAWGGAYGFDSYVLRCANDSNHTGAVRPYKPSDFELIEKRERKGMTNNNVTVYKPRVTTMSKVRATEIVNSLWGDAPAIEKAKAIMVCMDYGANPLMKHIFLIPFNKQGGGKSWEMVFGIKFKRLLAYRVKPFSYSDNTPRLMTEDEQKRIYGEVNKSFIVAITILVDEKGNRYPGYGRYPVDKEPKGVDKGNSKANMAMIRSEAQALEKMAPGQLPDDVGVVDAEFEELPTPSREISVDADTGEIKEKKPQLASKEVQEQAEKDIQELYASGKEPTTIKELCEWAAKHGKDKTPSWIEKTLGVKDTGEIVKDIPRAYKGLKEITGWEN
jgi:hypothetical protein